MAPLYDKVDAVRSKTSRSKLIAAGTIFTWTSDKLDAYNNFLVSLRQSVHLSFPHDQRTICGFTDASVCGWALIATQVSMYQDDRSLEEQIHELLVCMGFIFRGAHINWSVTDKEGYLFSKACIKLEFLLGSIP